MPGETDQAGLQYAGIVKKDWRDDDYPEAPWRLLAAFTRAGADGTERVAFAGKMRYLAGDIKDETFLTNEEAAKGFRAIVQTLKDIQSGAVSMDAIPDWRALPEGPEGLKVLYRPEVKP